MEAAALCTCCTNSVLILGKTPHLCKMGKEKKRVRRTLVNCQIMLAPGKLDRSS